MHLTSSGTRSVATARGASLPRSRLEMRLGGAGKTRNGHSYIIRDRNNVRFPFPSPGDLRIDPSTNQPTGEAFTLSPKRTYAGRLVSKFCTRNRATHEENNCESYSRDGRTRVIARNARECRLINYHTSLYSISHFHLPLRAKHKSLSFLHSYITLLYLCVCTYQADRIFNDVISPRTTFWHVREI